MVDVESLTKLMEGGIVKLLAIIDNDDLRQAKEIDNVPPDEVMGILLSDLDECSALINLIK